MLKDFSNLLLVVLCDYGEYGENPPSRWHRRETNALMLATLCRRGQGPAEFSWSHGVVTLASQEILYFGGLPDWFKFQFQYIFNSKKKKENETNPRYYWLTENKHVTLSAPSFALPREKGLPHSHACPVRCCTGYPVLREKCRPPCLPKKDIFILLFFPFISVGYRWDLLLWVIYMCM